MSRPSFQFYPADWRNNAKLRRCSWEARGAWLEIMCLMHDSDRYGVLPWSLKDIAQAIGAPIKIVKELVDKGVLKGGDTSFEALIYVPRSGRKDGDPVTLIEAGTGHQWYSSRMVIDEYVRKHAGASTRFSKNDQGDKLDVTTSLLVTERAKLRARIFNKTSGCCYHCGESLGSSWEMDHLMPRSKGGRHTFANLVPSCVSCNQDKSDALPDDWAAFRDSPSRRQGDDESDDHASLSQRDGERLGDSPGHAPSLRKSDGSSSSSSSSSLLPKDKGSSSTKTFGGELQISSPQAPSSDDVVLSIPLIDKTEFHIEKKTLDDWVSAYPAVDVLQQLREMRQWCIANPTQRKTKRGVYAFVTRWLGKEQDKGGVRNQIQTQNTGTKHAAAHRTLMRMSGIGTLIGS